ncbi:hypothetical protein [Lentisalinibacter sediminis]|uniref:hypothetical protein n=1 Tax=Lentisalinibacter sediminis TaxID=2992237 RepID=UPI00386F3F0B
MKTPLMLTATCLLTLLGTTAVADEAPGRESATDAATDGKANGKAIRVSTGEAAGTLRYALLPARFRHRAAPTERPHAGLPRDTGPGIRPMEYRDRAPLITRLKELDGLRLLTFWETRAFAVFFGVSRDGVAGLNIAQKKDDVPEREEEKANPADPALEPAFLAATAYRR